MVLKPIYSLDGASSPTVEISQEYLQSLVGQIEAEFQQSDVYGRSLAGLQAMLGEAAESAQVLVKTVGREAIRLACRYLTQSLAIAQSSAPPVNGTTSAASRPVPPPAPPPSAHLLQISATALTTEADTTVDTQAEALDREVPTPFFRPAHKPKKRLNAVEQEQLLEASRDAALKEIGQTLRQARESASLSITQLHNQTLVPMHLLKALEDGNMGLLPEDVYVRGFIRRIGNALKLDGGVLAASLPAPDPIKSVVPSWYHPETNGNNSGGSFVEGLGSTHLYLGYAALMAGAVGGLVWISQQSAPDTSSHPLNDPVTPSEQSSSLRDPAPISTPGLQSARGGVSVGGDIAPPEAMNF